MGLCLTCGEAPLGSGAKREWSTQYAKDAPAKKANKRKRKERSGWLIHRPCKYVGSTKAFGADRNGYRICPKCKKTGNMAWIDEPNPEEK